MLVSALVPLALLTGLTAAKKCTNATVPVTIEARQGIFNIDVPQTSLDATTLIQNITQQGRNFSDTVVAGYQTVSGTYNISTQFCVPDDENGQNPTVQVLTHGIGFDKTYWDNAYNNFNYSYVDVAVDQYKYCTLSIDRLGIGMSSHGEPLNEIQAPIEVAALAALTRMLREGTFPSAPKKFQKVVHVGHSFGAAQTYALANMYPELTSGIVLTGFSMNASFMPFFAAGANFVQANTNQPFRLGSQALPAKNVTYQEPEPFPQNVTNQEGEPDYSSPPTPAPLNYPNGYLTNSNEEATQFLFFLPKYFDQQLLIAGEKTKQPVTPGELLTLPVLPMLNQFCGPVLVFTGSNDLPYCGGNCLATGDPAIPNIPSTVSKNFPSAVQENNFETYIQPNTGHGLNFHYNATNGYKVIQEYINSKGLAPS